MLLQDGGAALLDGTSHRVTDPESPQHPGDSGPANHPVRRPQSSLLAATTKGDN
jgi:hypothetical protein